MLVPIRGSSGETSVSGASDNMVTVSACPKYVNIKKLLFHYVSDLNALTVWKIGRMSAGQVRQRRRKPEILGQKTRGFSCTMMMLMKSESHGKKHRSYFAPLLMPSQRLSPLMVLKLKNMMYVQHTVPYPLKDFLFPFQLSFCM